MKQYLLLLTIIFISVNNIFGQCAAGEVEIFITTGGGTYDGELWISITTGANATGTVLWDQGNGTIGNAAGALTNQSICAAEGTTYYVNTYDEWGDSWNGATFTITANGVTIATSAGSPDDGDGVGGSGGWDGLPGEFESSEPFTTPEPFPTDVCEDDSPIAMSPPQSYDATSGMGGIALILVTDAWASEITFDLYDIDGNLMYNETSFPGAPGSLANNTVYTIFDNSCFDVTNTAGVPDEIDLFDSGNDGIFDNTAGLTGAGFYIYYYAADAIEVFNNDDNGNGIEYITPGTGGFPAFYTANTNKRTNTITHTGASTTGLFPPPSSYEYLSMGTWSGTGVSNSGTITKTYYSGFLGLERTITVPNGTGQFDPSAATVGPNSSQTYTYYDYYGSAGPAPCNTTTITSTEIDVHARPTISPVLNQTCGGSTYNVTVDVNLGTYNVSVDEDGVSPFTVNGSGGTVSTSSISGTGTQQITITNIPIANNWSININDTTGISCGLTGTTGNCTTVLPVKLISFWGININNENELRWATSTEINNDFFILEKSIDGINFQEFGNKIIGAGNSSIEINYSIIDPTPYHQTYYRLKQVDFNGEYAYSTVITLKNNSAEDNDFTLYPTLVENKLNITIDSPKESSELLFITNTLGQNVFEQSIRLQKGANKAVVDLSDLTAGIYFVNFNSMSSSSSQKFIKQ